MGPDGQHKFCVGLLVTIWLNWSFLELTSVGALGANIICNKIPGLAPRQRTICRSRPDAIVAVGEGAKLGLSECQFQFRHMRWNCTSGGPQPLSMFRHLPPIGLPASKEAAYRYAIDSAAVTFAITQACSQGNLTSCGCDESKPRGQYSESRGFQWGGCSADIAHGLRFARKFMDAREMHETSQALMNRHNNRVGRKILKDKSRDQCKCHGVSGACTMKTCWTTLPNFRTVGDALMKKYRKAKMVVTIKGARGLVPVLLKLKRSKRPHRKPKRKDLVYLEKSPSYCEYNSKTGSLGTVGRICNRTSSGTDSCDILCCGRGYNTHEHTKFWPCNCKFEWCCKVNCQNCHERFEMYTCK